MTGWGVPPPDPFSDFLCHCTHPRVTPMVCLLPATLISDCLLGPSNGGIPQQEMGGWEERRDQNFLRIPPMSCWGAQGPLVASTMAPPPYSLGRLMV